MPVVRRARARRTDNKTEWNWNIPIEMWCLYTVPLDLDTTVLTCPFLSYGPSMRGCNLSPCLHEEREGWAGYAADCMLVKTQKRKPRTMQQLSPEKCKGKRQ